MQVGQSLSNSQSGHQSGFVKLEENFGLQLPFQLMCKVLYMQTLDISKIYPKQAHQALEGISEDVLECSQSTLTMQIMLQCALMAQSIIKYQALEFYQQLIFSQRYCDNKSSW